MRSDIRKMISMKDALKETFFCDCKHPVIEHLAEEIRKFSADPHDITVKSFLHVRDKIPFGFDLYKRKASDTLSRGFGACWNKSLLLTALLRCNHIPAYFGSIPVKRTFFSPMIGKLTVLLNNPFYHCITWAGIHERWIILDTVLDPKTYNRFFKPAGADWGIEWNGKDDCRLYTESVLGPAGVYKDIDAAMVQKAGNRELPEVFASLINHFLNKRSWNKAGIKI